MSDSLLLIPEKADAERATLAAYWQQKVGPVRKIAKFWKKPSTNNSQISLYGFDSFCLVLAQLLELNLVEVEDSWITQLDEQWTKRTIQITTIAKLKQFSYPLFVKPVVPKLFRAAVYQNAKALTLELTGLSTSTSILSTLPIVILAEAQSFIMNATILDLAIYEGTADLTSAHSFLTAFLASYRLELPLSLVIDLAYNSTLGWFILEFNASWGAGLTGCDPAKIWPAIEMATIKSL